MCVFFFSIMHCLLPLLGGHEYNVGDELSGEFRAVFIDLTLSLFNEPAKLMDKDMLY